MTSFQSRLLSVEIACSTSLFATGVLAQIGSPSVDPVGYFPNRVKVSGLRPFATNPSTWKRDQNGSLVATVSAAPKGLKTASGDKVHHVDFSKVNALYMSNTSEKYDDGMLNILESGKGAPDILDTALAIRLHRSNFHHQSQPAHNSRPGDKPAFFLCNKN